MSCNCCRFHQQCYSCYDEPGCAAGFLAKPGYGQGDYDECKGIRWFDRSCGGCSCGIFFPKKEKKTCGRPAKKEKKCKCCVFKKHCNKSEQSEHSEH